MTRLYLVRHGRVQPVGTFYGQLDVPLSARGREEMAQVAEALAPLPISAVISSDLARAADGAALIAARHGLTPLQDPAYREMHLGVLEGLRLEDARQRFARLAEVRYRDMWRERFEGGGENLQDVADRVRPALQALLAQQAGDVVVLVAHNSVNRVIIGDAMALELRQVFDFAQDFGCINRIDYDGRVRVGLLNWLPGAPLGPEPLPTPSLD